ncbi:MAG: dihydrodipicolinate synthase family protein [Gemmatimonadaceae bacterium]
MTPETQVRARELRGIFAPVVTNFGPEGSALDERGFLDNLAAHLDAGMAGIVVAGSTGEAPLLDDLERQTLVAWARAVVPADRWLIAGTGSESTRQCIRRTQDAADRGADAVLVVAPHYYTTAMTDAALSRHFHSVADESPIPILLYNIPKYAHLTLAPALVAELARHEKIIGIKDSSGDLGLLAGYLQTQSKGFAVLTGNTSSLAAAFSLGARGAILAAALFAPRLALDIREGIAEPGYAGARAAGENERVTLLQRSLAAIGAEIVANMGVAGVKAALEHVGLAGGPVRSPLLSLDAAGRRRVASLLPVSEPAHAP